MRIECRSCNKIYQIPGDRLPQKEHFSFPCPSCKKTISLNLSPNGNAIKNEEQSIQHLSSNRADPAVLKKKIIQGLTGVLPAMPQIVLKAQEIMSNPNVGLKELARVIATDQAISVRTLKLANSAYYGLAGKVTSIGHASVLLGTKTLSEIIMMAGTLNLLGKTLKGYDMESGDLWRHSLFVGIGSRIIATKRFPEMENEAFMAGLVHDSGKIMLDPYILEKREALGELIKEGQCSFLNAEKEILGLDHSQIGYEACKSWGIPDLLTRAIKYHHVPSSSNGNQLAHIVHVADYLSYRSRSAEDLKGEPVSLEEKSLSFLNLEQEELDEMSGRIFRLVEKISEEMLNEGD